MSETYSTRDLYLAGAIYSKGIPFQGIRRDGQICWFLFQDKKLCEEIQQQFFAKAVDVNAKEFADALRTLKDLVFSE